MDLELDTVPRIKGRAAKPLTATVVREIVPADLALLASEKGSKPQAVKKLRDRHHALARALADGFSDVQVSIITGYSASRVSILKSDPSVKQLIEFYREGKDEDYRDFHKTLAGLSQDAAQELMDRLEDDPNAFSNDELLRLLKEMADRTGYGPTSKQEVSHTVNFGQRLEAARRRMKDVTPQQIEGSPSFEE